VIVAVQREIEAKGIPTVLITVMPQESKTMRPPRAIYPVGHTMGRVLGVAGDVATQKKTLREALKQFEELRLPGQIIDVNI
jgi:hypothetical protein